MLIKFRCWIAWVILQFIALIFTSQFCIKWFEVTIYVGQCIQYANFLVLQAVTPQRLEVLRLQLSEEIDHSYRERFQRQESELDELRITCNKFKHELTFLKSEYEHEQNESRQIVSELKLQHDAEVIMNQVFRQF